MSTQQNLELVAYVLGGGAVGHLTTRVFEWATNRKADKKVIQRTEAEAGKYDAEAVRALTAAAVTLVAPLQAEVAELRLRVDALEDENTKTKTLLQLAIEYIRALRSWISTHIPDKSPPQPPADLGL